MSYIGKQPAKAPLTSSDVADGIISNAKLAQDIISAETALGATPADTDELLVSDAGTLKRMDYSHIKSTATWTKIKTITINSSTSAVNFLHGSSDVVFDSTYKHYKIFISGLNGNSSTNWALYMRVYDGDTDGSGTSLDTGSNYKYTNAHSNSNNAHSSNYGNNVAHIQVTQDVGLDNTAGIGYNLEMTISNTEGSSTENVDKIFHWHGAMVGTDDHLYSVSGAGSWQNTGDKVRGVSFFPSTDNMKYGEFILYGIS